MTSQVTNILLFLTHTTLCLKQFYPEEIVSVVENSCLLAHLSDDVLLPKEHLDLLEVMSQETYELEPLVTIGFIRFDSFRWQNNQTLKEIANEKLNMNDFVLFLKNKKDRTCLLQPKSPPPKVIKYTGQLKVIMIIDFINNHCNTYRKINGGLSNEGLHRNYILDNLFSVSSMSSIKSENIFTQQDEKMFCEKHSDNDFVQHDCSLQDENRVYSIPKCPRIKVPTEGEFFHEYLKLSKPVIIEGAVKSWKAFQKWSNKFLRKEYGDKNVHIKLTSAGEFEGVEPIELWDNFRTFKIPDQVKKHLEFQDLVVVRPATLHLKFSELVDLIENVSDGIIKNVSAYLEYSSIPEHLPDLEDDIEEFRFIANLLDRKHLNIWFSDGNTLGKLHFDPFDNLLCQISGRKQVILFEPHDNQRLYEGHIQEAMLSYNITAQKFSRKELMQSTSMVMSPVDIKNVNYERFPKFRDTHPLNCTLEEGDVLFMPAFWWHEVQSFPNKQQKRNLAVNYWYEPFLTKEFPCPSCKLDVNPKYRHLL